MFRTASWTVRASGQWLQQTDCSNLHAKGLTLSSEAGRFLQPSIFSLYAPPMWMTHGSQCFPYLKGATMEESNSNAKDEQLAQHRKQNSGARMTEDSGSPVHDDEQTLRAGRRGPTMLQDTHFYRKQSHFNREQIPEKVVHARGFGVHGVFELTESLADVTKADFLQEPGTITPVFVRFSNFIGSRGSMDTAIDVRGFATKF